MLKYVQCMCIQAMEQIIKAYLSWFGDCGACTGSNGAQVAHKRHLSKASLLVDDCVSNALKGLSLTASALC